MNRPVHGCPCCDGALSGLFTYIPERASPERASREDLAVDRRAFLAASMAVAVGATACRGKTPPTNAATRVFVGGTILTVDEAFSQAEAIAIRGNRILAVGDRAAVVEAAGGDAELVDLGGRTMLPGFIDPHTHVLSGAAVDGVSTYVGMARFETVDQVLTFLTAEARSKPAGEWIVARNFDPAVQTGPDRLTTAELDAVSTEHPVFVMNASGHIAYCNSKAFEAAGIDTSVVDPPGGEFVRDERGELVGEIKNMVAFGQVFRAYPVASTIDPVESVLDLLARWSRLGLTCVSELSLGALTNTTADAKLIHALAKSDRLTARLRAYPFYTLGAEAWDAAGAAPGNEPRARIAGYKLVADGSNQGFTGLQREPYLGSEEHGLAYMSAEELRAQAVDRAKKGWHLAIHGNGDAAIDNILDACEAIRDAGVDMTQVRARIEHCSILQDDQIERMKDLGVSASFLIGHVHYWGVWMRDAVFGEDKARLLDRCASAEKAGIPFSLHSDFTVTDPNPLHMIQMAVTRRTWKDPDYVLAPDERISVEAAIRAVTIVPAWQMFSEHEIGSLEAGKFADLVILDQDPRTVDADAIQDIAVSETWMDGELVYRA